MKLLKMTIIFTAERPLTDKQKKQLADNKKVEITFDHTDVEFAVNVDHITSVEKSGRHADATYFICNNGVAVHARGSLESWIEKITAL